ncbi:MAG: triose-phosphate isomerase [Acidithiobacillus sp.]
MVAGNWKMHGLSADAHHLTQSILDAGLEPTVPEVVLFPPFTLLHTVSQVAKGTALRWGGQNLFWENQVAMFWWATRSGARSLARAMPWCCARLRPPCIPVSSR